MGAGGVTFYLIVRVFLFFRFQQSWQKQRVLREHHVDHGELDELRAHRVFRKIQVLYGSVEGLQKCVVLIPKSRRQASGMRWGRASYRGVLFHRRQ